MNYSELYHYLLHQDTWFYVNVLSITLSLVSIVFSLFVFVRNHKENKALERSLSEEYPWNQYPWIETSGSSADFYQD